MKPDEDYIDEEPDELGRFFIFGSTGEYKSLNEAIENAERILKKYPRGRPVKIYKIAGEVDFVTSPVKFTPY